MSVGLVGTFCCTTTRRRHPEMAVIDSIMDSWKSTYTVRRVFGDAVEKGEVIVIPVAMVAGGGGGGSGSAGEAADGEGEGGGFGGVARPVGVYVVRADGVHWNPALDVTMLGVAGIGLSAVIAIVLGWALRRRG
jgi:uncharacterized spore protein YtfJ